jgi:hypothetical protein
LKPTQVAAVDVVVERVLRPRDLAVLVVALLEAREAVVLVVQAIEVGRGLGLERVGNFGAGRKAALHLPLAVAERKPVEARGLE